VQPRGLSSRAAGSSAHAGDVRVVFIGFAVRQLLSAGYVTGTTGEAGTSNSCTPGVQPRRSISAGV